MRAKFGRRVRIDSPEISKAFMSLTEDCWVHMQQLHGSLAGLLSLVRRYGTMNRDTNREDAIQQVIESFQLIKDPGFKIKAHMGFSQHGSPSHPGGLGGYPTLMIYGAA
ncbi:hypothetical protein B0O80DRAFT_503698 [Mortierella sp. GBAus27b]|nr:hypothetical protein B0O80DRAFT_503698 [Mortierella sp. GBAus27b]